MMIRPASELRNNFTGISRLVKEGETVFLTRNGSGDMVVMSQANYDRLMRTMELYAHLAEAEEDIAKGYIYSADEVYTEIDQLLRDTI